MKHLSLVLALLICIGAPLTSLQAQDDSSRIGLGDYGQTTVLDNRFNPAISFIGDMVATWSDDEGIEAGADGFKLRGAEIGLFGAVDNAYEFHGIIFFDDEDVELEEAYVLATDWLTPTSHIKDLKLLALSVVGGSSEAPKCHHLVSKIELSLLKVLFTPLYCAHLQPGLNIRM